MTVPTYTTRTSFQIPDISSKPFDCQGAVGPEYVIVVNNQDIAAHNKAGTEIWTATLETLFGVGASPFDPRIVFDPVEERFYVVAVRGKAAASPTGSQLLIAVSQSATPSDTQWDALSEEVSQSNKHWLDYPMIGYNANEVTITGKLFPKDTQTGPDDHNHIYGYLIPKADLLLATPTLANLEAVEVTDSSVWFPHPIVDVDAATSGHSLWRWSAGLTLDRLDVVSGSPSTIPEVASLTYTDATGLDGEQPSGATDLDNHANTRISAHPVKIGGFFYFALSGRNGTDCTIVVFKIDASDNTITAQTTLHESGVDLLYPAIAVNASGHIVIGCSASGTALLPGVMVFVGQDDGATMTFAAGDIVKDGERVYDEVAPDGRNRWGDYNAVEIDPTDNNRFWSINSYGHDNLSDNHGRQMEITEIITEPAGWFDVLGLTVRRFMAGVATFTGRPALARGERRPTSWAAPDRKEKWTAARRREKWTAVKRP